MVFSGGCDKAVRMWQLQGAPQEVAQQIGSHDAPVKAVGFLPNSNMVVSGGWDKQVRAVSVLREKLDFLLLLAHISHSSICFTRTVAQVLGSPSDYGSTGRRL